MALVHGCYYENWAVYRPAPHKFGPDHTPVDLCTHVFYAFAAINAATYTAKMQDEWADSGLHGYEKVNELKKKKPSLKTILSFGGWSESQTGVYARMASQESRRQTFIHSAWALANKWGFDGIDIDWEYPDAKSKHDYTSLMKEFRAAAKGKLLTAAVSADADTIDAGYDASALSNYLDYLNVMTYDYHGTWDKTVQHHASYSETHKTLAHWAQRGMHKSKILIGIPAYGVGWQADQCKKGAHAARPAPAQSITTEEGSAAYFELMAMSGGHTVNSDEGPYWQVTLNGHNTCYGYDDPASVQKKMHLVKSEKYGGAFTWAVDMDSSNFPLHHAIHNGLGLSEPAAAAIDYPVVAESPIKPCEPDAPSRLFNDDHSRFAQCVLGSWLARVCPAGSLFDPRSTTCREEIKEDNVARALIETYRVPAV